MSKGEPDYNFFDEQKMVQRTNIFQTKSIYGVSALRDIVTGTVTQSDGEYILLNAGNGDVTILDTAERGPYQPGYVGEMGAGFRAGGRPTGGTKIEIGVFGDEDGFLFRIDRLGLWRDVLRDSVNGLKQIGYWNKAGDKIVTIGDEVIEIDMVQGHIYQIPYSWYAFGPSEFTFQLTGEEPNNKKWLRLLDRYVPKTGTSVRDPQQPIRIKITSGVGDPAYTAYVGGRQYSILGKYDPIYRETSIESTVSAVDDSAWFPLMSVRRKAVTPYALTQLKDLYIRSEGDVRVAIELNGTVSPENYVNPPDYTASETLLEVDLAPSATLGTGTLLQKIPYAGGQNNKPALGGLETERLPLIEQQPFIIYVRRYPGDTTAIQVDATATFREDY